MASAGIEPAARWASTSRSTSELQKPSVIASGTDGIRTRTPPIDSQVRFLCATIPKLQRVSDRRWHGERMTPPPGSRGLV